MTLQCLREIKNLLWKIKKKKTKQNKTKQEKKKHTVEPFSKVSLFNRDMKKYVVKQELRYPTDILDIQVRWSVGPVKYLGYTSV